MAIELWQKLPNEPEKMIGAAKIPLHQFHIAFHETNVMNRVIKQKVKPINLFDLVKAKHGINNNNFQSARCLLYRSMDGRILYQHQQNPRQFRLEVVKCYWQLVPKSK